MDGAAIAIVAAALLLSPLTGHVDDLDAQVYRVVAANMARGGSWIDASFLPDYWPQFREHLPFGFWPAAAAMRLWGESAGWIPYALASFATVALVWSEGRRLAGPAAGLAAALVLSATEVFWQYGARILLEPLLLLCATAAAAQALRDRPTARTCAIASAWSALAVLVKGPFGLVPFVATLAAGAIVDRSARRLLWGWGGAVLLLGVLPAALFLGTHPSWYQGYLLHQLQASASGARDDGVRLWSFPLRVIANRFWPALGALPFAIAVLWRSRDDRRRTLLRLTLACGAGSALLCLPVRKWGNHAYVLLPLFAIWAGVAFAMAAEAFSWRRPRWLSAAFVASAAAIATAAAAGAGRLVLRPPCLVSTAFRLPLSRLPAGSRVAIVDGEGSFPFLAALAAETALLPTPSRSWTPPGAPGFSALIGRSSTASQVEGFRVAAEDQRWTMIVPVRGRAP